MENTVTWDALMVHSICLKILGSMELPRIDRLLDVISQQQEDKSSAKLLLVYMRFSIEQRKNPRKFDNFEAICSAIYRRLMKQKSEQYNFTVMYEALFGQTERYYRFARRKTHISLEEVGRLWEPGKNRPYSVPESPQRRLWENVLLSWDENTSIAGRDSTQEREMLALLWKSIEADDRAMALKQLNDMERQKLMDIEQGIVCEPTSLDGPNGLYDLIIYYRKTNKIKNACLFEILGIDSNGGTFGNRKRAWMECEANGFQTVPNARLSKQNIIDLSLLFHLTIPQAYELMMKAGYIFTSGDEGILSQLSKNL